MGKLIFFDVDGTLFRHDCLVPESTVRSINELEKNGHTAMVCTGRGACTLPSQVEALPLHGGVRGCGTFVEAGEKVLTDAGVEGPVVYDILDILRSFSCPFFVENSDYFYSDPSGMPESFQKIIRGMSQKYIGHYRPVSDMPPKIAKITAYPQNRDTLPDIIDKLSPWFDIITHDEYAYIEIVTKGCSKGTGVLKIMEELGVLREDTYGFGDSKNDIPMLDAVGTGIVMGDAPDDLKSKYMSTDSIYKDGIEKALIRLGLI